MNIIDIWNYYSDSKKLIGKSNAIEDQLPPNCTTIEPPAFDSGQIAVFDEPNQKWLIQDDVPVSVPTVITVYSYAPDTLIYIGSCDALSDSLAPNSTTIVPTSAAPVGYALTFNEAEQSWINTEDHRGETVYNTTTAASIYITTLGPYPANTTTIAPVVVFPIWDGSQWGRDTEAQNQSNIKANIKAYRALMQAVALAQCPLSSASGIGLTLTQSQLETLAELQQYAVDLGQFIESADLTKLPLTFPVAPTSLLFYLGT